MKQTAQLSELYLRDMHRAISILKEAGCTQVFVFGSLTTGKVRGESDIDLAIRGCPKGQFFHLLGRLLLELEHPVDLIDLDRRDAFARYLEQEGGLVQIG
jgi:predicted nucleotidyltransferase